MVAPLGFLTIFGDRQLICAISMKKASPVWQENAEDCEIRQVPTGTIDKTARLGNTWDTPFGRHIQLFEKTRHNFCRPNGQNE